MSKIKIVTDSTVYVNRDYAKRNSIDIVPLSVTFEGETKDEGYPGEFDEFYEKLKNSRDFPVTSQPSIGVFVSVFENAIKEGYEVIAILISSKLSGTYSSAMSAAKMVNPDMISIIDSETTVSNMKILIEKARKMVDEGLSRYEIVKKINNHKKNMGISLTVDTLEYLKRGGRLTTAQAFVGSLLNIKPIIALEEGKLIPVEKVRGKNKAINAMISRIPNNAEYISICHILNYEEAEKLKLLIEKDFPNAIITIDILGPVIGSHLGPKAIGICHSI